MASKFQTAKPYLRITFKGLLSFGIISGVYSWMPNVNGVNIAPSDYDDNIFHLKHAHPNDIVHGLSCLPTGTGITSKQKTNYCNQLTHSMMNVSDIATASWNCELHTDFSDKDLIDVIPAFSDVFIWFISCAAISSAYSIIHDSHLVYHRDHISNIISYPQGERDFPVTNQMIAFVGKFNGRYVKLKKILCCCLLLIPFLIVSLVEFLWTLCLRQFFLLLKSMRSCQLNALDFSGFTYVASTWVAISRGFIMYAAGFLLLFGGGGYPYKVDSMDPESCNCACLYLLYQSNLYGFFIATCILIFMNIRFLYNWYKEAVHGQQYLYLISYTLPMRTANNINHLDPTGDMFKKTNSVANNGSINGGYALMSHSVNIQDRTSVNDVHADTMTATTINCRFLWSMCCYGWIFLQFTILVVSFGIINFYDYPEGFAVLIFVFGILSCLSCSVSIIWYCRSTKTTRATPFLSALHGN